MRERKACFKCMFGDGNGDKLREPDSIGREGLVYFVAAGIGRQGESKIYVSRRHKSILSPLP